MEHDIPINKDLILFYNGNHEDVAAMASAVGDLAARGVSFNGLVASDDILAIGAVTYAKSKKISIPDELSVIGYNNSVLTKCCDPLLTSVDNRLESICDQLVKTLLGILQGNEMPQKTIFSGEIVKHGTTK